jgi:uncharacterized protein YgiM (DUF1202 family)
MTGVNSASRVYADEMQAASGWKNIVKYTNTRVKFRTGPSTDDEVLQIVDRGASVEFKSDNSTLNGWSLVVFEGVRGYIKSEFLGWEEPPVQVVELLEWSQVKPTFTTGVPVEVYDVRTGLVYYVKSFSNGMHADVEPATKEDTAIMKQTYNNRWAWDGRPVWVTINGRTIAAAINGMPHGGGVNATNDMAGQVCLHFKGSAVHNGNTSYQRELQVVVMEAWNAKE